MVSLVWICERNAEFMASGGVRFGQKLACEYGLVETQMCSVVEVVNDSDLLDSIRRLTVVTLVKT